MNARSADRWAAATGFASIACAAGAEVFERGAIRATAAPSEIAAYYADNSQALRLQGLLFLLSSGFALWFFPTVAHVLARAEGGRGRVAGIALVGAVTSIAVTVIAVTTQIALATAARYSGQPALLALVNALFVVACMPSAVMFCAVAVVSRRTGVFPAWMAWLSVLAAVTQLVPVFGVVADSGPLASGGWISAFLPYPLYTAWVLCAAVLLMRADVTRDPDGAAPGGDPHAVPAAGT
ncbi:MAG: hypothetical protein U0Q19_22950 [Kineosporiaceae bacterium]